MLHPVLTNLLIEARVETLHRAARNAGCSRRVSGTTIEISRSPARPVASRITRAIARVFDGARCASDKAAVDAVVGHGSTVTWSSRS
jgi:hypothetical protein